MKQLYLYFIFENIVTDNNLKLPLAIYIYKPTLGRKTLIHKQKRDTLTPKSIECDTINYLQVSGGSVATVISWLVQTYRVSF